MHEYETVSYLPMDSDTRVKILNTPQVFMDPLLNLVLLVCTNY